MTSITLDKLKKALLSLDKGFMTNPSELERDGIIQRFEFCVELCWKSAKKILAQNAIDTDTPKNVFREMAQLGWIDNPELWLEFIAQRNKASHIYNEEIAQEIFKIIPSFMLESKKLIVILEKKK
jgi:nucleotidyltransferase substrate binding protein (TIGR01987 family)